MLALASFGLLCGIVEISAIVFLIFRALAQHKHVLSERAHAMHRMLTQQLIIQVLNIITDYKFGLF